MDDLLKTFQISASGLKAQSTRLRIISENVANADSLPQQLGDEPYRRKLVTFRNELDKRIGLDTVRVDKIRPDDSEFKKQFNPSHPAADADGYVLTPNVNTLIEMSDMREAQRSYQANLKVLETTRSLAGRTLDLLRG